MKLGINIQSIQLSTLTKETTISQKSVKQKRYLFFKVLTFEFRLECRWTIISRFESNRWNICLFNKIIDVGECLATENRVYDVVMRSFDLRSSNQNQSEKRKTFCFTSNLFCFSLVVVDRWRSFDNRNRAKCFGNERCLHCCWI